VNYKLYVIDMAELIGESLSTCQDNQGKTCYKIPYTYYNYFLTKLQALSGKV
jgi:hypothetical protein